MDDTPSAASLSDDDISLGSVELRLSVDSGATVGQASKGASLQCLPPSSKTSHKLPLWWSTRLRELAPPPPPRRSKRLRGEATGLASHPDYARCDSLVSDQMKHRGFIHANKAQFGCTLGTKQPPRSARLSCKKKEYRSRLTSTKLKEANEKLGILD